MNISITFHVPFKSRLVHESRGILVYKGVKNWLFNYGGLSKQKWIRILGITFLIGYWNYWPIQFNLSIQ